ncbi:MAG: hypothetical protein Alpg2KO_09080 [Alphaproteobacteria bacterium]
MKIALAFPELGQHGFNEFASQLEAQPDAADLLMLPEGFEQLDVSDQDWPMTRAGLRKSDQVAHILSRYQALADSTDTAITAGLCLARASSGQQDVSINGAELDQWAFVVRPGKQPIWYHKHTTSALTAMGDKGWSAGQDLPVFTHKGRKIGLSICHDMYLSPIPRALKQKGAEIWVNLSYQNVRPHMWTRMLRARAVENDMIALCTLHRNSTESNPQNLLFGQAPKGQIILRRLSDDTPLDKVDRADRCGALYTLNTDRLELSTSTDDLSEPQQDDRITGRISARGKVTGSKRDYHDIRLRLTAFLHQPERIWQALHKVPEGKTPILRIEAASDAQFNRLEDELMKVIGARGIEFGTLITVDTPHGITADTPDGKTSRRTRLAAWRSSNYKDVRICAMPDRGPLPFDERFLFGPDGTVDLLADARTSDPRASLSKLTKAAAAKTPSRAKPRHDQRGNTHSA